MKFLLNITLFSCLMILSSCNHMTDNDNIQLGGAEFDMEKTEAPDERREFEKLKRGGELNILKIEQGRKTFRKLMKERLEHSSDQRDGGLFAWQDLGPKNIGGRIRAIAIDPNDANVLFIGAAAGGIWRSTDGGTNWTLRNSSFQAYPVTSIVYDPFDSDVMYASTGEYRGGGPEFPGAGVLKSTDGGDTWFELPLPQGVNFLWLSKIVMNPSLQNSFYVSGSTADLNGTDDPVHFGLIYRSNDGGQTYNQIWIGDQNVFDMEINPTDTSELIIGTDNDVLMSSNSGGNFTSELGAAPNISNPVNGWGARCEVEYCDLDPNVIFVSRFFFEDVNNNGLWEDRGSHLWRSPDGGANWNSLSYTTGTDETTNVLTGQGNYSHALWSDPSDCTRALFGGINLWKWQNNTLTRISDWVDDINGNPATGTNNSLHADFHFIIEDPGYNGVGNRSVWIANDGGIYGTNNIWTATQNNGWFARNTELNITQLYGADISHSGDTVVGGSQDNSYFFDINNNNGFQTWTNYSTGDGGYCAINKSNPNFMYTTTQRGSLYRSSDGGQTFCHIVRLSGGGQFGCCNNATATGCPSFFNNGGANDTAIFIAPFKLNPQDPTRMWIGGRQLWLGFNNGNNWASIKPTVGSAITTIEPMATAPLVIWVGHENGDVYRTVNGIGPWVKMDDNGIGLRDEFITDIAIHPLDQDQVMVTVGGYEMDHIFLTEDGGANWEQLSLGFDMHVESVTWHPTILDWVYVGTDVGLFASQDRGQTWSVDPIYAESEGPVYTRIAELFWQGDGSGTFPYYLCAATHGRGLWRSFAPVTKDIFVDKECQFFCGLGTEGFPFKTFREALEKAGPGNRIVFKTAGIYEEGQPAMLVNEDIEIVKAPGVQGSIIIK